MLKDELEIYIITYNRREHLDKTLKQIFNDKSAIKDYNIIILDNASTDGTDELVANYQNICPNLKYIRHHRNIGGNANIARAFELASKKYVWILCDDDEYDFTHWDEVELAADMDYDAIVVANYVNPQANVGYLVKQMTFTPSTIYKTDNLTQTVMSNIEFSIHNMFPHLAVASHILNNPKKKIYICNHWAVRMVPNSNSSYVRGLRKDEAHPYMSHMFWSVGYINAIQMIKSNEIRKIVIDNMCEDLSDVTWKHNLDVIYWVNKYGYEGYLKNILDIWFGFLPKHRRDLITDLLKKQICKIFSFKNSIDKRHKILTFLGIKFKIKRPIRLLDILFSVKNTKNKKHKVVSIIGFKFQFKRKQRKKKK